MDHVIRQGALRLQATETTCDVILSCQGSRLMAHKLILSIASPILRELFLHDTANPTVLILPDINYDIMSSILDYIYTGNVVLCSNLLNEFISVANLLKIQLDIATNYCLTNNSQKSAKSDKVEPSYKVEAIIPDIIKVKKVEELTEVIKSDKNLKKSVESTVSQTTLPKSPLNRKMCGLVITPSPWCPRIVPVLADPRQEYFENLEVYKKLEENDSNNNNFQYPSTNSLFYHNLHHLPKPKPIHPFPFNLHLRDPLKSPLHSPPPIDYVKYSPTRPQHFFRDQETTLIEPAKSPEHHPTKTESPSNSKFPIENTNNNNHLPSDDNNHELDEKDDIKDNNKQKPFKCVDCGKCFSQLRNYKYHRSVHEGTKEFAAKCPECGKIFNDKGYLSSHMKIHRDRKEYACPHCPKRFNQRVAYNMHLRIHTGVKPHECSVCGKSFSRKMLLKQHQRVHTGERPYSCPECGKTFADRSNMSLHARLHTGVKPYACNLCPKSFTKKHHLKTHMNFHTGLKPYTCQKCGLAFSQSSNMRTHYKKCILKESTTATVSQPQELALHNSTAKPPEDDKLAS